MKRLLSLFLALCLLAAALPMAAASEEDPVEEDHGAESAVAESSAAQDAPAEAPAPAPTSIPTPQEAPVPESLPNIRSVTPASSDEEIRERLQALRGQYPSGTPWGQDKYYDWNSGVIGPGYGSQAFACQMSDLIFGTRYAFKVTPVSYYNAKLGDVVAFRGGTRFAIVTDKSDWTVTLAEGNVTGGGYDQPVVRWGVTMSAEELQQTGEYLVTRSRTSSPDSTPTPAPSTAPAPNPVITPVSTPQPLKASIHIPSEREVYNRIMAMKPEYYEGRRWTNADFYQWKGGGNPGDDTAFSGGFGCTAFACRMSDAAFGDLKARSIPASFSTIRVGDILRMDNDTHEVIIISKDSAGVTVAEGNWGSAIHWGRRLTADQVNGGNYVFTRYPDPKLFGTATDFVNLSRVGENVGYTLDANGEARLRGTGRMYMYQERVLNGYFVFSPVHSEVNGITSLVVENGVTGLSDVRTFANCTYLKSVNIQSTKIARFEKYLFMNCASLPSINLPQGLREIGPGVFSGCTSLKTVYLPATLTKIEAAAFGNCPLTDIYFGGTRAQWEAITIENGSDIIAKGDNSALARATMHFSSFTDVPVNAWYSGAVDYVKSHGLMSGTGDGVFSPDGKVTRAQMVTVLYSLEGRPAVADSSPFSDVTGDYYYKPVCWAAQNGLVSGYGGGRFGPHDTITRQDFALILRNYAKFKGYDISGSTGISSYQDAGNVSSYARPAMQWAVSAGLLSGSDNKLMPKDTATRAQMAVIMKSFCQKVAHLP